MHRPDLPLLIHQLEEGCSVNALIRRAAKAFADEAILLPGDSGTVEPKTKRNASASAGGGGCELCQTK